MKKAIICILAIMTAICIPVSLSASALEPAEPQSVSYTETFEDGSYGIVTITVFPAPTRASTSGQKKYTYYNANNVKQWTVYLNGTFTYTGSSATCTAASTSYSINNNTWSVTKAAASRSGATATGSFTVKKYTAGVVTQTVNKTLTLTCSASGTLS